MTNSMKTVAVVAAFLCLLAVFPAPAQTGCQDFHVLVQANLDLTVAPPGVPWSGMVRGFLNGTEPLIGTLPRFPSIDSSTGIWGSRSRGHPSFWPPAHPRSCAHD